MLWYLHILYFNIFEETVTHFFLWYFDQQKVQNKIDVFEIEIINYFTVTFDEFKGLVHFQIKIFW